MSTTDAMASPFYQPAMPQFPPEERSFLRTAPSAADQLWSPPSQQTRSPPPQQTRSRVYVHACGRIEALALDRFSIADVSTAARSAFDLPSDQEILLTDKDGERLVSDTMLHNVMARAETVYLRLSEGALHDFERRIDQLQHMQIGYLCDQLATFRQEQGDLRSEIKNVRLAMEQEQAAREFGDDAVRRELETLRLSGRRSTQQGEERLEALEALIFDGKHGIQEEAIAREHALQDMKRSFQEFQDAILAEGKAREGGDEKLKHDIEELRRSVHLEVHDRESCEVRIEKALMDLQKVFADTNEANKNEAVDIRRQFLDVKQVVTLEQRERISADTDLADLIKDVRTCLQTEVQDRASEDAAMFARCEENDTLVETEKLVRQQAITELTQQLSIAVESIQEEQTLRSSLDAELSQMFEALRRSVDETRRRMEDSELTASRLAHDLAKRFDEEVHTRDVEVSRVMRLLSEESDARQQGDGKATREIATIKQNLAEETQRREREVQQVSQRLDDCYSSLKVEQTDRISVIEELTERVLQQRRQTHEDEIKANAATDAVRELREEARSINHRLDEAQHSSHEVQAVQKQMTEEVSQLQQALIVEQKERTTTIQDLASTLKEARLAMDSETQTREKGDIALSRNISAARESLEEALSRQQESFDQKLQQNQASILSVQKFFTDGGDESNPHMQAVSGRIRNECLEVVHGDLSALHEGLKRVVEAVQQERSSRTDADGKLREDCRLTIQKEINARLESHSKLHAEIEAESGQRHEAVELIHLAIEECRHGLETHTHELDTDGSHQQHSAYNNGHRASGNMIKAGAGNSLMEPLPVA